MTEITPLRSAAKTPQAKGCATWIPLSTLTHQSLLIVPKTNISQPKKVMLDSLLAAIVQGWELYYLSRCLNSR